MTSRLAILRSRLARLREARSRLRAAAAWSALASSLIIALLGIFIVDFVFGLATTERIVVIALATAAAIWSFWRFTRPLIGHRESEIDMALLVQRQQEIDSDLVAALQFESTDAKRWGSSQLTGAVVDYVAAAAPTINVFQGIDRKQTLRRAALLAVCLAVVLLAAAFAPRLLTVFFNRLLLGSRHYPTRTQIDQIVINGTPVFTGDAAAAPPADNKAAQGRPVTFLVKCSGQVPNSATITLTSASSVQGRTRLELRPLTNPGQPPNTNILTAELPRLNEDISFRVTAGDAWSDPALIRMIPLPIVELKAKPLPPKYAAALAENTDTSGRQFAVLEGSEIQMQIESTKPLESARLTLQKGGLAQHIDLTPRDAARTTWSPASTETALINIRQELRYEIQVADVDGLSLESPIRGTIRIRPDQPPTGLAETIHKIALPTAAPLITYRASDDYGISALALLVEVERGAIKPLAPASNDESPATETQLAAPALAVPIESHRFRILSAADPLTPEQLPTSGSYALPLSSLNLTKGDRLKLTLEITDYRGDNDGRPTGQAALSDSLALEISDESGVLAAISQADQRSEQQLSEIIKRQLGIGEQPQ